MNNDYNDNNKLFFGICVFFNRIEISLMDIDGKEKVTDYFTSNVFEYLGNVCNEGFDKVKEIINLAMKKNIPIETCAITVYGGEYRDYANAFWIDREKRYFLVNDIYKEIPNIPWSYPILTLAVEDATGIYIAEFPKEVYYIYESGTRDFVFYDPLTGCLSCFIKGQLITSIGKYGNLRSSDLVDTSMMYNMMFIEKSEYIDYCNETYKQYGKMLEPFLTSIVTTLNPRNLIIGGETVRDHDMNGFWSDSYYNALSKVKNNITNIHSFNTSQFNARGVALYCKYKTLKKYLDWEELIVCQ